MEPCCVAAFILILAAQLCQSCDRKSIERAKEVVYQGDWRNKNHLPPIPE